MSRTLNTHVSLWGEAGELVTLAPGDAVPSWAEGRVGEHCLEAALPGDAEADENPAGDGLDTGDEQSADENPDDEEGADSSDESTPADEVPDFTAAAPRRNSRSRK